MSSKEEPKNTLSTIVAATLIGTGAIAGIGSAITNNEAGLITNSGILIAGEIVRNNKKE